MKQIECPFCGLRTNSKTRFCENCGKELIKTCHKCKKTLSDDSLYCPSCGEAYSKDAELKKKRKVFIDLSLLTASVITMISLFLPWVVIRGLTGNYFEVLGIHLSVSGIIILLASVSFVSAFNRKYGIFFFIGIMIIIFSVASIPGYERDFFPLIRRVSYPYNINVSLFTSELPLIPVTPDANYTRFISQVDDFLILDAGFGAYLCLIMGVIILLLSISAYRLNYPPRSHTVSYYAEKEGEVTYTNAMSPPKFLVILLAILFSLFLLVNL